MNGFENPIPQIVDAVADTEDLGSFKLKPPIVENIDPDALEPWPRNRRHLNSRFISKFMDSTSSTGTV
jgi:hypothetical protein